jgi:hypothetical protein
MIRLTSASLVVDILDPAAPADAAHLGARFCHGGFIWQISLRSHDGQLTPLLSGPEFPASSPDPFNGQGLPESFRHRTRDGSPLTWDSAGTAGVALGAGHLVLNDAGQPILTERCHWQVESSAHTATFHTRHATAGYACELTRRLTLADCELCSTSTLTNTAPTPLALQWFAHPFWPLTHGTARIALPAGTSVAPNPGFAIAPDGALTFLRPFVSPEDSQFCLLALPSRQPLSLSLSHPVLSRVTFATSFAPDECPVWANARTVSVEPYLTLQLSPGESRTWEVRHGFQP